MVVWSTTSRAFCHFVIFNDDGQRVQLARLELPAPHYICMNRLLPTTPPSPSMHYYIPTYRGYQFFTDLERMDILVRLRQTVRT